MSEEVLRKLEHDDLKSEGLTEQEIKILSEKGVSLYKNTAVFTLIMGEADIIGDNLDINEVRDFIKQPMIKLD